MRNSIVTKLRSLLLEGIDSECKVVYLLAESRKLLDGTNTPASFAVSLYINWALHVELDRNGTTRDFLKRVDAYVGSVLDGNRNYALEYTMNHEFVLFDTFRKEFRGFLEHYALPTTVCEEGWHEFVKHYCGVIDEGSLACSGTDLSFIDKVVFRKGPDVEVGAIMPFKLVWDTFKADKKLLTIDANAVNLTDGELMHTFGIKLEPGALKQVIIPLK